jgi:uncharacterized surface protein with fasciclin (FAS1) repeats
MYAKENGHASSIRPYKKQIYVRMKFKLLLCILCAVLFIRCDEENKYYEKPGWLEDPIYQVLEQQGRFGLYLQCVDRTSYAAVLRGAGLYTVFAPNDEAFSAWLKENSYSSVAAIPAGAVEELVAYSIVYSKWTMAHLGDYFQEGIYVPGAFKRKTNLYTLPYRDAEFDNAWVIDQTVTGGLSSGMNNYKYLPVYTQAYFSTFPVPLTDIDYTTFYPNSTFTGKNVQSGAILKEDIQASNGIVFEVSTVNMPLPNMDRILKGDAYSTFKALLDHRNVTGEYAFRAYSEEPSLLDKYQKMMPDTVISSIYVKTYSNTLAFSPLLENIYSASTGAYDPEKSGYALFVPQNNVLNDFIQTKLLKYYTDVSELPLEVISTLINTHMSQDLVWPSLYATAQNSTGEYINGEGSRGRKFADAPIVKKTVASNGFVYQTSEVVKSRFFETVYSEIFLNPAHTLLNRAYVNYYNAGLREDLMKSVLNGYSSEKYAMLNFSDALLKEDGFAYDVANNSFSNSLMSTGAEDRLKRLMRMHVFPGLKNDEINSERTDFSGGNINYGQWGFTVNYYGDAVRFRNNQLQAAGNIEDNTFVTLTKVDDYNNGVVFNVDRMLQYSPRETGADDVRWKDISLWKYLDRARRENPNVSLFVDYVERCLKNPDADDLDGIKPENYYTVLMPNNSAMQQAVTRGYLQALANVTADNKEAFAQATKFLNAHILSGRVLVDDGNTYIYPVNPMEANRILAPTLLKISNEALNLTNEQTFVEVTKTAAGLFNFLPMDIVATGSKILVDGGFGTTMTLRVQRGAVTGSTIPDNFRSNRIACKAILHEINNFFIFEEKQ